MIDPKMAADAAENYRAVNGYRPMLLALLAVAHGDGDCWEPPSKAHVKRKLTRPRDEFPCNEEDLETTIILAAAQGLLAEGSTAYRLELAGGEAA